eukprot:scaffold124046_cov51-Phaeocystis_antarctica.AAC.1
MGESCARMGCAGLRAGTGLGTCATAGSPPPVAAASRSRASGADAPARRCRAACRSGSGAWAWTPGSRRPRTVLESRGPRARRQSMDGPAASSVWA